METSVWKIFEGISKKRKKKKEKQLFYNIFYEFIINIIRLLKIMKIYWKANFQIIIFLIIASIFQQYIFMLFLFIDHYFQFLE